ncbi:unnamed protein product, partial [marine sediment metagenome]
MKRRTQNRLANLSLGIITLMVTFCILSAMISSVKAQDTIFVHPIADAVVAEMAGDGNWGHSTWAQVEVRGDLTGDPWRRKYTFLKYDIPENLL